MADEEKAAIESIKKKSRATNGDGQPAQDAMDNLRKKVEGHLTSSHKKVGDALVDALKRHGGKKAKETDDAAKQDSPKLDEKKSNHASSGGGGAF